MIEGDVCDNANDNNDQRGDVAFTGEESEIVCAPPRTKPPQAINKFLLVGEKMEGVIYGNGVMERDERGDDTDLGNVELSDLLELEKEQRDDFTLYDSNGTPQLTASQQKEVRTGFATYSNNQNITPTPNPSPPLYPPPPVQIPGLNLYNHFNITEQNDRNPKIPELPPINAVSMTASLFDQFEEGEEEEDSEDEFPDSDFIKTEVYITNAEWWLWNMMPYRRFRCKVPSSLRTSCTMVDTKEDPVVEASSKSLGDL
jgi:hypothetical protein